MILIVKYDLVFYGHKTKSIMLRHTNTQKETLLIKMLNQFPLVIKRSISYTINNITEYKHMNRT